MPFYESTFVTRQDVSRADVNKLVEQFSAIVKDHGGKVVKHEYWGLRNLAYRIKKNRKGHYVMLALDAPFDAVKELERNMRLHEDIIRNLTVRVDSIEEGPSPMMQKARGDEEGGESEPAAAPLEGAA